MKHHQQQAINTYRNEVKERKEKKRKKRNQQPKNQQPTIKHFTIHGFSSKEPNTANRDK